MRVSTFTIKKYGMLGYALTNKKYVYGRLKTKIGLVHRYMEEWWTNDNDMNNEKIIPLSLEGHKRKGGQFQSFGSNYNKRW